MYPKYMYHVDFPEGIIFNNEQEEKEAGEGYVDSPALLGKEVKAQKPKK